MVAVTSRGTGHDPPPEGALCASRTGRAPAIRVSQRRKSLTRCAPSPRGICHIPPNYVVEHVRRSSKAARGEDLQVEHPVWCGYAPAFHFHATLAGMLSPTL